jgi:tetratricopeptide (TPR) repeat protein
VLAASAPEAAPLAPLLEPVLDLPMEDTDATRGMPAPVRKQVLEQILAGSLRGRAQIGPVCVVVEDVHWIDSLSRDLLSALAGVIADVPVLLLLAYRPPQDGQPIPVPAAREIELRELPDGEASQLAAMLLSNGGGEADAATLAAIIERANGNPFYIEELVRDILERGGSTSELPSSLENLILGRIDRLADSQQLTIKVASVIGRRVPTGWLTGAYAGTLDVARLPCDLTGLSTSGLIVADTPPPDEAYLFRHAIVREVTYETLGFGLRQNLHEQLATHLEVRSETPPVDLLAYHFALSADTAKEAQYRRLAAELAIRNGAYADALAHVERATEIVAAQPGGAERLEQELELALLLGTILLVIDGQGSAKAKAVYDRARELSRAVPPGPAAGRAIFGLWTYYLFQGLMGPTEELADEAVALTTRSPDPSVRIMAHLAVCQTHLWTGKWDRCVEHYHTVLELYDPSQHQAYITQYAQNPRFTASNSGFWAEWMVGHSERARIAAESAIEEARALEHDFTYTIAFLGRPMLAYLRRRPEEFLASTDEYVERAQRAGNPFYIALSLSLDASAKILRGEVDAGLAQLEAQYAAMRALGSKLVDPLMVSLLGDGYLAAGRHEAGLALLDASMASFERDGRVSFLPDHLRLRAQMLLGLDPAARDEALTWLMRAVEVARSHGARSFELRAALAAGGLLRESGRGVEGRALVASAYAGFTESFDDPDLCDARAFLS